ncbi:MAG: lysophospholipid acyltransferase family protein [Planctomycetota bacterium]
MDPAYERKRTVLLAKGVVKLYAAGYQRRRVLVPCPIPDEGPALVAANHSAGIDPLVIQSTCRRPIIWIMDKAYYEQGFMKWLMQWSEMIPIDRENPDSSAWRTAMKMLKKGRIVGIFPEGRIERERKLLPFQSGVAMLAANHGVPFYPCYVDGPQRNKSMLRCFLVPQRPTVAWGEALPVKKGKLKRDGMESLTTELRRRVDALRMTHSSPRLPPPEEGWHTALD